MQKSLLPTCLVLYSDDTFEFINFGSSIKTTVYRKFSEIAKRIEIDKIVKVLFVSEMYLYDVDDIENLDGRERIKHAKSEFLTFDMVDNFLRIKSHLYNASKIDDFQYVASIMFAKSNEQELPKYMNPVIQEFARLKSNLK